MEFKGTKGKWLIKHSEIKNAFNIIGTQLGGRYKIARLPYLVIPEMPNHSEIEKSEANANAQLIIYAPEMLEMLIKVKDLIPIKQWQNKLKF